MSMSDIKERETTRHSMRAKRRSARVRNREPYDDSRLSNTATPKYYGSSVMQFSEARFRSTEKSRWR